MQAMVVVDEEMALGIDLCLGELLMSEESDQSWPRHLVSLSAWVGIERVQATQMPRTRQRVELETTIFTPQMLRHQPEQGAKLNLVEMWST